MIHFNSCCFCLNSHIQYQFSRHPVPVWREVWAFLSLQVQHRVISITICFLVWGCVLLLSLCNLSHTISLLFTLTFCFYRKIASIQINHKIGFFAKFGQVSHGHELLFLSNETHLLLMDVAFCTFRARCHVTGCPEGGAVQGRSRNRQNRQV